MDAARKIPNVDMDEEEVAGGDIAGHRPKDMACSLKNRHNMTMSQKEE
jgi:hypothetical protein